MQNALLTRKNQFLKKASLVILGLAALPAFANNDKGFYVGLGVSGVDDRQDSVTIDNIEYNVDTKKLRVGEVIGGYKYNAALGGEIRLGSGFGTSEGIPFTFNADHSDIVATGKLERKLGTYESIYYKPELVNDDAKLYALLGYTHLSSSVKNKDLSGNEISSESKSYSGFSYGLGIGFVINERFNVNFEYKNLCEELYDKPNAASINIDYRF